MTTITCPSCGKEAALVTSKTEISSQVENQMGPLKDELSNTQAALLIANTAVANLQKQLDEATRPPAPVMSLEDVASLLKPSETEPAKPAETEPVA